jgi:copper chaperone CopZ
VKVKVTLNVGTIFCYDCVMALRKFIGSVKGVISVDVEDGKVAIDFDPAVIGETKILQLARDSVEKLGYKILD